MPFFNGFFFCLADLKALVVLDYSWLKVTTLGKKITNMVFVKFSFPTSGHLFLARYGYQHYCHHHNYPSIRVMFVDFDTYSAVSVNLGRDSLFVASKQKHEAVVSLSAHMTQSFTVSLVLQVGICISSSTQWSHYVLVRKDENLSICRCAHRTPSRTLDSWHSSTSGKYSDTSPFFSQSSCCDLCRSTRGHTRLCRGTSGCRCDPECQRSRSQDWGHRNWVNFHNKPGRAL